MIFGEVDFVILVQSMVLGVDLGKCASGWEIEPEDELCVEFESKAETEGEVKTWA